jgi:phosphopantetheinyl transferase
LSIILLNSHFILNKTSVSWMGIERLQEACLGIVILDMENLAHEEGQLFTPRELEKSLKMRPRRQKSFAASRVALKHLSRHLGLVEDNRLDRTIETLGPDGQRPCLGDSGLCCSVSHSSRFVIAVAHQHPVGVDIEGVSDRIQRVQRLFLCPGEKQLLSRSGLDFQLAATRVWSTKEAAAKALGLHLFQAVREVKVVKMEKEESSIRVQEKTYPARHSQGDGQVIALVTCDDL